MKDVSLMISSSVTQEDIVIEMSYRRRHYYRNVLQHGLLSYLVLISKKAALTIENLVGSSALEYTIVTNSQNPICNII